MEQFNEMVNSLLGNPMPQPDAVAILMSLLTALAFSAIIWLVYRFSNTPATYQPRFGSDTGISGDPLHHFDGPDPVKSGRCRWECWGLSPSSASVPTSRTHGISAISFGRWRPGLPRLRGAISSALPAAPSLRSFFCLPERPATPPTT